MDKAELTKRGTEILDSWWPIFFGQSDMTISGTTIKNTRGRFTDILLESNYEFWSAYVTGDYDTVFKTPGFPDIIDEAIRFKDEQFDPVMVQLEEKEVINIISRLRVADRV